MNELIQAFEMTTPTGWIISVLLTIIIYFLNRFMKSFDEMKNAVETITKTVVAHETIVDGHEKRLDKVEKVLFNE